jgi:hypothetical protein
MAAAGLGNAFSDVAGIGLAHHIEYFCSKLTNEPVLSSEQFSLSLVSWFIIIVKIFIFLTISIEYTYLKFGVVCPVFVSKKNLNAYSLAFFNL